jgi:hypothetical protein
MTLESRTPGALCPEVGSLIVTSPRKARIPKRSAWLEGSVGLWAVLERCAAGIVVQSRPTRSRGALRRKVAPVEAASPSR